MQIQCLLWIHLSNRNGYEAVYADAGSDQEKQIEDVEGFIKQGVDYIILNPISEIGWDDVLEDAKKAHIPVILVNNGVDTDDSSLYSCMLGSDYGKQMKKAGKSLQEITSWIKENIPHFCLYATVDDLKHLYRGGRVSKTTAFLGTAIGIKPILKLNEEGNLVPIAKVRGRKQSIQTLVKYMEEHVGSFLKENDTIYISHGDCEEDAKYLAELVKEKFGIMKSMINHIGPVIGSHAGPGALALSFMGENK